MDDRKYQKLYEAIMRGAERRMRLEERRELERRRKELRKFGTKLSRVRLDKAAELRCVIEQIDAEVLDLSAKRDRTSSMNKRVELKAAIVHLRETRARLLDQGKRKPPESGISIPAVSPNGPWPKQGGAAAPLEFE